MAALSPSMQGGTAWYNTHIQAGAGHKPTATQLGLIHISQLHRNGNFGHFYTYPRGGGGDTLSTAAPRVALIKELHCLVYQRPHT